MKSAPIKAIIEKYFPFANCEVTQYEKFNDSDLRVINGAAVDSEP